MDIKRNIIGAVQLLLVGVILFSGMNIFTYKQNLNKTDTIEAESRNMVESVRSDIDIAYSSEAIQAISKNFIEDLQKDYPDAVGHIEIDDSRISHPIVQYEDNDFYLHHSPDQSVNANGSIFLDFRNNERLNDDNNIIYGHYIPSGKLFHDLYKFREQEFVDRVYTIELQTLDGPKTYQVFSVYDTDPSFQYRYVNYEDKDDKMDFINTIVDRSLVNVGNIEGLDEDAKILTLSTCSNKGSTRLVVHGVEIE